MEIEWCDVDRGVDVTAIGPRALDEEEGNGLSIGRYICA
jgi:hypothetical protein